MYCSTADGDDCKNQNDILRTGLLEIQAYGIEDLLFKYGVDLNLVAHGHNYERLWPVYDEEVYNGTRSSNPYDNPGATVHITSGSAGCQEYIDGFDKNPHQWSAYRHSDYGSVVDKMMLIKDEDNHGNYGLNKVYQKKKINKKRFQPSLNDILKPIIL